MKKLRSDSMIMGAVLGIIVPLISFGILYGIEMIIEQSTGKKNVLTLENIALVSIFVNLATLRFYLLKLKFDRTGRGILIVTFLLAIVYFAYFT